MLAAVTSFLIFIWIIIYFYAIYDDGTGDSSTVYYGMGPKSEEDEPNDNYTRKSKGAYVCF